MSILSGISDFFGLDIGTTALRVVQLQGSSSPKSLVNYAHAPIDVKIALSDSKADQQKLVQALKELLAKSQINTHNVAVGLPSQNVFTSVVDIERLEPAELAKSIRLQADSLIPTPISESKLDWILLGDSPADKSKVEVLITSVTNKFVESRLEMLESIGLDVIAFEPDAMALTRALVPVDNHNPQMILDVGSNTTDLVITMAGAPRLTRAIPTGTQALVRAAAQNLNIEPLQAQQFIFKFGVGKDKLEGQVYNAIIGTVEILMSEIEKSIKFFHGRYADAQLEKIVVTGSAATIPELPLYIANKFSINVEIGNSWRNVNFPASRQNELLAVSHQFGVAAGLAERME